MKLSGPGRLFSFHRKEQAGVFVLLGIAVIFALLPRFILSRKEPAKIAFSEDSAARVALIAEDQRLQDSMKQAHFKKRKYFYNTSEDDLIRIGFSRAAAKKIREKVQSDKPLSYAELTAISGMDSNKLAGLFHTQEEKNRKKSRYFSSENPLELNSTDSATLCILPGIGGKTAKRILDFRNKLGGFYQPSQILETLWVDTVTLKSLLPVFSANPALIHKIDLKNASPETLAGHPYLSKKEAALILSFAKQHQRFLKEDLLNHPGISAKAKSKMPYYLLFYGQD